MAKVGEDEDLLEPEGDVDLTTLRSETYRSLSQCARLFSPSSQHAHLFPLSSQRARLFLIRPSRALASSSRHSALAPILLSPLSFSHSARTSVSVTVRLPLLTLASSPSRHSVLATSPSHHSALTSSPYPPPIFIVPNFHPSPRPGTARSMTSNPDRPAMTPRLTIVPS
jgi:hypothetical protein